MKKTALLILLATLTLMTACSDKGVENAPGKVEDPKKEDVAGEVEEGKKSKELIPLEELAILKTEETFYDGRPFENVPVQVTEVAHYADKTEFKVRAVGKYADTELILVIHSPEKGLDVKQDDFLRLNGVVNSEIDFESFAYNAQRKVNLTSFDKVEFMDTQDTLNVSDTEVKTNTNGDFTINITKVDTGDEFTRIYFSDEFIKQKNISGSFIVKVTQDNKEIKETDNILRVTANSLILKNDQKAHVAVFPAFDTTKPYSIEFEYKEFMTQEPLKTLKFEIN